MKAWENAELEELKISETQYGSNVITRFDNVYFDENGNFAFEFAADESTQTPSPTPAPPSMLS